MSGPAPLGGRVAIVTGASRGIGLATAHALATAGARVAMLARGEDALRARAREIGHAALPLPCDVTDADAVARTVERVTAEMGAPADLLINNAGLFTLARLEDMRPRDFADAVTVNLVAPFYLVRAVLPAMRARRGGHLITVGSVADRAIFPENGAYAASKFGARAMHEVLRAELRGTGIRATLVSPGPTDTALWDAIDPDTREGFLPRAAMLRPEAAADAIVWAATRPSAVNIDELRLSPA